MAGRVSLLVYSLYPVFPDALNATEWDRDEEEEEGGGVCGVEAVVRNV